jgi:RNA polymerase sigma factor (TIGR02999 family)
LTLPAGRETVTAALSAPGRAGRDVVDAVIPLVYDELRRMARRQLAREHHRLTLDTTGLVHEAYLRLVDQAQVPAGNRAYFFGAAAQAMRRILVESARRRRRLKRGEGRPPVDLADLEVSVEGFAAGLVDLDEALERLAGLYPRQARVVECRFFGGLSVEETAAALEQAPRTVKRDWALAQAWLFRELGGGEPR